MFGQGMVPTPHAASTDPLANVRVNMADPSSLLKDTTGIKPVPTGPPKQLPMPPLLKKKDSLGALNNALTRALSQPGSRAASRPESPSRMFSLPPDSPQQFGGTSGLLSQAAQDLASSITDESSSAKQQADFKGIATTAMSQIVQNTITIQKSAGAQQASTWGFPAAAVAPTAQCSTNGHVSNTSETYGAQKSSLSRSKSVSALNVDSDFEINDPKPMEKPKLAMPASFKPLEPSHQTHHSPIKVPKPVSPISDNTKGRFSNKHVPPIEARGSVLAPTKGASESTKTGQSKADYSYYLDLINDGADDVEETKPKEVREVTLNRSQSTKQVTKSYVQSDETASKNSVKNAKSIFENGGVTKQQATNMSKSCGNLNKLGASSCNGSLTHSTVKSASNMQARRNETKHGGSEASNTNPQLKVQVGHDLASLLAKDEMQSSILVSPEIQNQNEELVVKESLVHNVRATSAKWSASLKNDEKIITFDAAKSGSQQQGKMTQKHQMSNGLSHKNTSASGFKQSAATSAQSMVSKMNVSSGIGLASNLPSIGNVSQFSGNPEELLLKAMQTTHSAVNKNVQHQTSQSNQMTMMQAQNLHVHPDVLEHQKKIEMERQKQEEYEMNQRRIVIEKDAQRNLIPKQNEENELKIQLERRRSMEVHLAEQQEEERKRIAAEQQKRQEEERRKLEMERQRQIAEAERQRVIEQHKREEARKKAEIEKQKVLEMQRREEERKRAEAEKQRLVEIQRQEEERKRAEAERQRILEIQRQEEERRRAEAERQRLLEIQRQEEERRRAEAERQRLLEIQRQEDERREAEEERLRLLQIQRQQEEQKRAEEERLRLLEMQRQQEEAKLRMEAEKARQEEERRLREEIQRVEEEKELKRKQMEQMEQQRLIEMQTLHQSIQSDSFLEEREKRQKIHEEQLRILRQKQEEEQKQLLMLQQQEEALWESKKSFIERSSSMLGSSQTVMNVTNTVQKASFDHHDGELIMAEAVKVHDSKCQQDNLNHVEEELVLMAPVNSQSLDDDEELIEYSAPVIHDGSRPSSVQSVIIPEPTVPISPEPIKAISPSAAPVPPPRGQRTSVPPAPVPAAVTAPSPVPIPPPIPAPVNLPPANNLSKIETPAIVKNDIVDDPLQFLLSNSPVSACSSLSSPSPVSAATSAIPSAPAPPPLQPSYASMATGDAIAELRSRFNETPVQAGFNDPVPPSPPAHVITSATSHNPPSKMHPPPDASYNGRSMIPDASYNGRSMVPDASYNGRSMVPDASYNDMRSMPASPTRHSSRPEVVSPASQKKRLMAQCMSEVASLKNAAVLPSNVKSARKKTTKSRVERFIEATCGEPQTVVRKTASGKEYLEVISPESTETARSLLEPAASR